MYKIFILLVLLPSLAIAQNVVRVTSQSQHPYRHQPLDLNYTGTAPSNGQVASYDSASGLFKWISSGGSSGNVGIGTPNRFAGYVGISTVGSFQTVEVNGNVGIGTQIPRNKLEVNGDIGLSGGSPRYIKVLDDGTAGDGFDLHISSGNNVDSTANETGSLYLNTPLGATNGTIGSIYLATPVSPGNASGGDVLIDASGNTNNTGNILMNTVHATAKVGIASASPANKLQVLGGGETINPADAAFGSFNYGAGFYENVGNTHSIQVYAYKTIAGIRVYQSQIVQSPDITDNGGSDNVYYIIWQWTASNDPDVEGYLVIKSDPNWCGYEYNAGEEHGIDIGNSTSWEDNGSCTLDFPVSASPNSGGAGLIVDNSNVYRQVGINTNAFEDLYTTLTVRGIDDLTSQGSVATLEDRDSSYREEYVNLIDKENNFSIYASSPAKSGIYAETTTGTYSGYFKNSSSGGSAMYLVEDGGGYGLYQATGTKNYFAGKLGIKNSVIPSTTSGLFVDGDANSDILNFSTHFTAAGQYGGIAFTNDTASNLHETEFRMIADTNYGVHMTFWTKPNDGNPGTATTERMRIQDDGNIAIGTTSSVNRLGVAGNIGIGTSSISNYLRTAAPIGGMLIEGNVGIGTISPSSLFEVGSRKFNVLNNGNVGIGSMTPGQILDVQGTIRSTNFIDTGITASTFGYFDSNKQLSSGTISTGLNNSSGTLTSNAVSFVSYQPGLLSAVNSTIGVNYKFSKASTVDNIIGSAVTFSCIGNPTVTMYECGTSTTCTSPTTIGTVTVTAAGTLVSGTVSNSAITAGDYIGWAITAGTCASIDIAATAQVHSN